MCVAHSIAPLAAQFNSVSLCLLATAERNAAIAEHIRVIYSTQSSMVRLNKDALRNTQLSFYRASKPGRRAEPKPRPLTRAEAMAVVAFVARTLAWRRHESCTV